MPQNGILAMGSARLWAEFLILFCGVPLLLAFALPPTAMFTVLGVFTAAGVVLLARTDGFRWAELIVPGRFSWRAVFGFALSVAVLSSGAVLVLFPGNFLMLQRQAPELWLMIMVLYPLVSAVPQELIFRPLFFRRYGSLFPDRNVAILANAALFALAHLMYQSGLVLAMTFAGGLAFAWAYQVRGSFILACVLHAVAGQIVFTSGLGILFYSGAVN